MTSNDPGTLSRAEKQQLLSRLLAEREARARAASSDRGRAATANADNASGAPYDERTYRVEQFPEYRSLQKLLTDVRALAGGQNPYFQVRDGVNAALIARGVETQLNFSSYNYLGLAGHPEVRNAAKLAIDRYGTSVSASRLGSGEVELHGELERALAAFLGAEAAIVYVGGHAANVTTVGQLMGPKDVVFYDALIHNSVLDGVALGGAQGVPFAHNDVNDLRRLLRAERGQYRRALIVAEGVYSMDGDIADLPALIAAKREFGALLMIDEAHSLGVIGARGGGLREHFQVPADSVDIWMGTLSKSLASCGGYVAGSQALVEYLKYRASGFVYSVGMTPPNAAAALASLRVLQEEPERVRELQQKSQLFLERARANGLDTGSSGGSAIVPVILGDSARCVRLAAALASRGIMAFPVIYPAVPEESSRLRFFITHCHSEQQIEGAVQTLVSCLAELGNAHAAASPS